MLKDIVLIVVTDENEWQHCCSICSIYPEIEFMDLPIELYWSFYCSTAKRSIIVFKVDSGNDGTHYIWFMAVPQHNLTVSSHALARI